MTPEEAERAAKLAYEKGVTDALTKAHFEAIDRHLAVVNGSISVTAQELRHLNDKIAEMATSQQRRDAVGEALAHAVQSQVDAQISQRQFWLAAGGLLIALAGLILAVPH